MAITGVSAGTALAEAQPPITGTEVSTFEGSFSDEPFRCQDELYAQTVGRHALVHFTYFSDTGAFHFHEDVHGKVVAVPLEGTGPTHTGNSWFSDTESIRAVKGGDLLVEQDTDFDHVVARGSDGSRVLFEFHAHFTVNANGEMSVDFDTTGWSAPDSTPFMTAAVRQTGALADRRTKQRRIRPSGLRAVRRAALPSATGVNSDQRLCCRPKEQPPHVSCAGPRRSGPAAVQTAAVEPSATP